jgi:hypothetical protein
MVWGMILAKQLAPCLQKCDSVRTRCFVATSRLEKRRACWSLATSPFEKIPSSLGTACSIGHPKERKSVKFEASADGTDGTYPGRFWTGHVSFWIIPVNPSGLCRMVTLLIESNKNWHGNCLISILWPVNRIRSLLHVSQGTIYNTGFFINIIIPGLPQNITSRSRRKMPKGWVIHTDNARPHDSSSSQECIWASKAEQPWYCSTWVLLLGISQRKMSDYNCASLPVPLKRIAELFCQIDKPMLIMPSNPR